MPDIKRAKPSPALLVAIVALSAALVSTAVAEPAKIDPAEISLNKRELKKTRTIAKRIARRVGRIQTNRLITRRAPGLTVENAEQLDGEPADSYEAKAGIRYATIAPANAAATVVRGRGATGVSRVGTGYYAVAFDRDVTGCTWNATYGQPNNAGVNALWATVRGGPNPNEVRVVLRNAAGAQADGNGFHLLALCP